MSGAIRDESSAAVRERPPVDVRVHAHDALERILLDLPNVSARAAWRHGAARACAAALRALHRLGACPIEHPDHLDRLASASERVAETRTALEGEAAAAHLARRAAMVEAALRESRAPTIDAIVRVQDRLRRPSRPPPAETPAAFSASTDRPALHRVDGDPVLPWVRLGTELLPGPEPDDDAEDAPEENGAALRGASYPALESVTSPEENARAHVLRIAHDCMAEIGALGMLRRARGSERRHAGIVGFERRLLADLDALVALATPYETDVRMPDGSWRPVFRRLDPVEELQRWASDAFVADEARAFARAFVLGCLGGEDTVRAAFVALRSSDPETYDAQRDALAIVSNPAVGAAARRLCHDEKRGLAAVALAVLRERREPCFAEAAILLNHPDAGVRRLAALALSIAPADAGAIALLEALLRHETEPLAIAGAAESLLVLGARSGLAAARRALRDLVGVSAPDGGARRDLARLVAVAGGPADADLLAELARRHPVEAEVIGWSGIATLTEPLRALLGSGHYETRQGAARALLRIAGPPVPTDQPAAASADDGTDLDALPTEPEAWNETCARLLPDVRYRFGRRFEVGACLDELSRHDVAGDARETCALELALIGGGEAWFQPHDWVGNQARRLEVLRRHFDAAPRACRPGEWLEGRLGKRRG